MKNFKKIITILALSAMVMSLSSCGTLGQMVGSGTLTGIATDILIGKTGQRGGVIGDAIENATGFWRDGDVTISVTSRPNWYNVRRNGVNKVMYLMPLRDAVAAAPEGTQIYDLSACKPGWNRMYKILTWRIPTNRGEMRVSKKGWYFIK